jgi:hypothetical protein
MLLAASIFSAVSFFSLSINGPTKTRKLIPIPIIFVFSIYADSPEKASFAFIASADSKFLKEPT